MGGAQKSPRNLSVCFCVCEKLFNNFTNAMVSYVECNLRTDELISNVKYTWKQKQILFRFFCLSLNLDRFVMLIFDLLRWLRNSIRTAEQ